MKVVCRSCKVGVYLNSEKINLNREYNHILDHDEPNFELQ